MKKIILSMLSVAMLAGCSKNENIIDGEASNGLVPIKLNSGIELSTKAAISGSEIVTIGCWESSLGSAAYTNAATWTSTASVNVAAAASITLNPVRYYNADNGIKSYLKGWYPDGTFSNGVVTITNADGTVDAILSNEVSGSKTTKIADAMKFEHLTAQLKFTVIKGDGLAVGTKIKSITVKGASVPTAINLAKTPADTDAATWTAVTGGLAVPEFTEAEITGTATPAGKELMIQPVSDNTTIKLDVVTSLQGATDVTFSDVEVITAESKIERGKAYTITLTFKQSEVTPTAHITEWATATGEGTVQ